MPASSEPRRDSSRSALSKDRYFFLVGRPAIFGKIDSKASFDFEFKSRTSNFLEQSDYRSQGGTGRHAVKSSSMKARTVKGDGSTGRSRESRDRRANDYLEWATISRRADRR